MDSDGESEFPEWADDSSNGGDDTASVDAHLGQQGKFMFSSSRMREFELHQAEHRLHRRCPGCGRFPLGDVSPEEVYSSQQREQWEQFRCLACYAIWQCSLDLKRDVVRVSGDVIWFSGTEPEDTLKIRLYNEIDQVVRQFGFARHIAPRADSDESLKCARNWLMSCMQTHTSCRLEKGMGTLPTRVIDVSLSVPRLVHSASVPAASYAALSHCWGSTRPLQTLRSNIESHVKGISLDSVPKTFRDAIRVTRHLDIGYLWIDSLCIIQDDNEDWIREAAQMGAYYTGAEIVISASSSQGSSEGFLGPRKDSIKGTLLIEDERGMSSNPTPLHFRESTIGDHGSIPRQLGYRIDALSSRGWCFQERLLARRLLSFDSQQLIWECNSACHCEGSDISNPDMGLSADSHGDLYDHDYNLSARLFGASKAEIHRFWRIKVIQHYASRNLTRESDRLIALQGIADVLKEYLDEKYMHGLWEGDILEGLTWSTQSSNLVGIPLDVAPTWSWASIYGRVSYANWPTRNWAVEIIGFTALGKPESRLRIHDNTPTLAIQLRSQLLVARMRVLDSMNPAKLVLDQGSGLSVIEAYLDTACEAVFVEDLSGQGVKTANRAAVNPSRATRQISHLMPTPDDRGTIQVWLLRLFSNKQQLYNIFLVLGLSKRSPGHFERIGTSSVTPKTPEENAVFESFIGNQPIAEVSII
ncbi:heterokaryon incompatibility protein-domain-containing protein [Hypoxylon argillaceum]|nr:heterokaryon incompatibility protein-domain-containing protein [Hypoxylon argillaceum]